MNMKNTQQISQGGEVFTAEGVGCVDQMIKHFRCPKFADFTFIAHNAAGFDSYMLLEYFTSQGLTPKSILQGCRLVYICTIKRLNRDT